MMLDAELISFTKENNMDPNDLFSMIRRERLISEEIYLREWRMKVHPRYVFVMMKNGKKI